MSRINRVPRGLQDLLGNINQGQNPDELLEGVRASFDIQPLWLVERLRSVSLVTVNPTVSTQLQQLVPSSEMWLVRSLSFNASNQAAANLRIKASFRLHNLNDDFNPGTNITRIGETPMLDWAGIAGIAEQTGTVVFTPYLVVPPDTIISALTGYVQNSAATVQIRMQILYYVLRV